MAGTLGTVHVSGVAGAARALKCRYDQLRFSLSSCHPRWKMVDILDDTLISCAQSLDSSELAQLRSAITRFVLTNYEHLLAMLFADSRFTVHDKLRRN
jgi:hypothetical protein